MQKHSKRYDDNNILHTITEKKIDTDNYEYSNGSVKAV